MAEWGGKVAQFLTWTAPWSLDWHPQTYQKICLCALCKGAEKHSTWWKKVYQCPVPSGGGMHVCFSQPGARGEKSEFISSLASSAMMVKRVKRVRASLKQGMHTKSLQSVRLFATPWALAHRAHLSMGFSRQEYWSGLPFPPPGDLPDPGTEAVSCIAGRFFTDWATREARHYGVGATNIFIFSF